MRSSNALILVLAALGAAAGCSDPVGSVNTNVDSGVSTDRGTSTTDTGTTNTDGGTTTTDTGTTNTDGGTPTGDRGPVDAGPPYDPCAAAAVIDLNAMGTTAGNVTRITRNNNSVGAMAPLRGGCGSPGHEVAFRYTPRASTRLRISTDNMGTDMMLDTVVWAQAACAPTTGDAGIMNLGCDDDTGADPRGRTSVFTTNAAVTMGTPLYIIVAGYTPPVGTGFVAQGNFELSVTEITSVAVGGACDVSGATNSCATGSSCIGATSSATMGTCTADGAANGACRGTGMACDAGLTCNGSATSSSSRCRTTAAAGAACDPMRVMNACATGTACVTVGGASTCQADGAAGRPCRTAEPRCDTGLTCSSMTGGTCRRNVAAGAACTVGAASDLCAMGTACLPTSATAGTCSMTTTAETEPNNTPAMAQATITASRIYTGMANDEDTDCFHVTVPMGAGLFVESNLANAPTCPSGGADPVISVYNPMNMEIESEDDTSGRGYCSTINPATASTVRNLTAGVYTVCIEGLSSMSVNYLLTIGIIPPG